MVEKSPFLPDDAPDGLMDRRRFWGTFCLLLGTAVFSDPILSLWEGHSALAQSIPKDDPRLMTEYIHYPGAGSQMRAYSAKPKQTENLPAVLVIHENRGLVPHIEDVARRLAVEGFWALAPDGLTPLGGTPEDPEKGPALIQRLDPAETIRNFTAAITYLKTHPPSSGKVGVVGFCWGGAMANQMAVHSPDLSAAVSYYGRPPALEDVPRIKAPLLLHYAEKDPMINNAVPAFEEALKKAAVEYRIFRYAGTQHAFNNDTHQARYHPEAAKLAWERTIAFFKEKLK